MPSSIRACSLPPPATLHIDLKDGDPPIWRLVEVPTSVTLKVLHDIAQAAMGCFDYHHWEMRIAFDRFEDIDADTFFSAPAAKRGPVQNEQEDAKGYLSERLADGPKPVKALKTDAEARGIGSSTLNRAADALDVSKAKGDDGRWYWSLPPED